MYIPAVLLPFVLGRDLTPKRALLLLHPIIVSLDLLLECQPLLDFLIAATTSGKGNEPPITVQTGAGTELTGVLDVITPGSQREPAVPSFPQTTPHTWPQE